MPKGGTVEIKAEKMIIDTKEMLPLPKGEYIKISIKDTGLGIPKKNLQKIFYPYFTTKDKGSGLGLATTFSIIKKHNGHITLESELGVGTTFYIYLPTHKEKIMLEEKKIEKMFKGEGKILLMDDDKFILDVTKELLTELGYEVELAKNGIEAIELYKNAKKSSKPFDAIIMDLTIQGGMGGKETIQEIIAFDPKVKAIVSSGYAKDPIMDNFKKYGFIGAIVKPYGVEELSKTLDKIIKNIDKEF